MITILLHHLLWAFATRSQEHVCLLLPHPLNPPPWRPLWASLLHVAAEFGCVQCGRQGATEGTEDRSGLHNDQQIGCLSGPNPTSIPPYISVRLPRPAEPSFTVTWRDRELKAPCSVPLLVRTQESMSSAGRALTPPLEGNDQQIISQWEWSLWVQHFKMTAWRETKQAMLGEPQIRDLFSNAFVMELHADQLV